MLKARNAVFRIFPKFQPSTRYQSDGSLKSILAEVIQKHRKRIVDFKRDHGQDKVGEVTVESLYGGLRNVTAYVYETSYLDENEGLMVRGLSIADIQKKLPKAPDSDQPLPEGIFWLLLTGFIPTPAQVKLISKEWAERAELPGHTVTLLQNLPITVHPAAQMAAAIAVLNRDSKFVQAYIKGVRKIDYWEYVFEDSMDLIARMPTLAATIYNNMYKDGSPIGSIDFNKDWSYNYAEMLGMDKKDLVEFFRLYFTIMSDHDGGGVIPHTANVVASGLADPYLSYSAAVCGAAGPLVGLAVEQSLKWQVKIRKKLGDTYTKEKLSEVIWATVKSGKVLPGFGHAILRKTDPRYMCIREFCLKHLPNDPYFKLVSMMYSVVPPILESLGKVRNPHPNVDGHAGLVFRHYGLTDPNYYSVLISIARSIGVMTSLIWARALGMPIERSKTTTSELLMKKIYGK